MNPAGLSVAALLLVMAASFTTRLNVGVLAVALAWPVAVYGAGWKTDAVLAAFPSSLFVTLLGVTLLFGLAQANGTMAALTQRAIHMCRGRAALLPLLLFAVACVVSTAGPGAVAAVALLAPLGMAAGARASLPPLLTALMLGNGANAGNLSPVSAVGVIVSAGMAKAGLPGHEGTVWAANFVAHLLAAALAWALFGGPRLWRDGTRVTIDTTTRLERAHVWTLAVLAMWMVAVIVWKVPLGLAAFAAVAVLVLLKAADDTATFRQVPWAVIVMVCGVSLLVAVLEGTGGLELF
ncbi:MAG TPA: SLC13 family permease, partial [Luteitalea sp.]|nr:SLC13 family permease [Luteitalea sp.]